VIFFGVQRGVFTQDRITIPAMRLELIDSGVNHFVCRRITYQDASIPNSIISYESAISTRLINFRDNDCIGY